MPPRLYVYRGRGQYFIGIAASTWQCMGQWTDAIRIVPLVLVIPFQHIRSIVTSNSVILMDTGHPVLEEFVPELQVSSNQECLISKYVYNNQLVCVTPSSASLVISLLPQQRLADSTSEKTEESLPYEFVVLDAMLTKMVRIPLY